MKKLSGEKKIPIFFFFILNFQIQFKRFKLLQKYTWKEIIETLWIYLRNTNKIVGVEGDKNDPLGIHVMVGFFAIHFYSLRFLGYKIEFVPCGRVKNP